MEKDLEFLTELDKKLHFITPCQGNGFWKDKITNVDSYTNEKMTKKEIDKILEISKGLLYIIYPINTCLGFSVGYEICKINFFGEKETCLKFKENQLPEGNNFKRMSETFMSKDNLLKAKLIGEEIVNNYSHYDY